MMKDGWKIKKLGEVCNFQNGFAFKSKLFKESGFPILRISNIQENEVDTSNIVFFHLDDYKENLDKYRILNGDLLIAMSGGTTGKIGVNTSDELFYLNQRVGKFEPKECLSKHFLFYFLSTRVEENLKISLGSAQPNLSTEQIKNFDIPLPPLSEQRRIVAILDEAFAGIAAAKEKVEQNLKNANEVFSSYLRYIFNQKEKGWATIKIGNFITLQRGFDITKKQQNINGKVPVVSSSGVKSFHDKPIVNAPGVVIGRKGTLGSSFYIEEDFWPHDTTLWVKNFSGNNEKFVFYFFNFLDVKHLDSGTANPALNRNLIHDIDVNWNNDIKYQEKIVSYLDSLKEETSSLESSYQQKLVDLEELKKSVLQQAFSGAL